eukprot:TRINITY_DN55158_c0_g1_i1.p1 TRINITY_DN55158_c0_g1~~TRINITY_DN55158_c0_g1_i1.p1  ORF type:complete len:367 (+),score=38.10 TRINITY_DN55158_c0_g1_i1:151-1251(+)
MRSEPSVAGILASFAACVAATVCLVLSAFFFEWSSEQLREDRVAQFEESVNRWSDSSRKVFSEIDLTALLYLPNGTQRSSVIEVHLASNRTSDVYNDAQNGERLPSYQALRYEGSLPASAYPNRPLPNLGLPLDALNNTPGVVDGKVMDLSLRIDGKLIHVGEYPVVKVTGHYENAGMYNQCQPRQGVMMGQVCWVYSRLSRLCVQISKIGGSWKLAPTVPGQNNSFGCRMEARKWEVSTYSAVPVSTLSTLGSLPLENIVMQVRSADDPYLVAQELTSGTLNFGMPALEEGVTGLVLLVVGLVLCCLPQGALCRWVICKWWKRRNLPRRYPPSRPSLSQRQSPPADTVGMRYAVDDDSDDDIRVR